MNNKIKEGSCYELFGCTIPEAGAHKCSICGKIYRFCKLHKPWALTCMNGHVMRVHPEVLTNIDIDKIIDNKEVLEGFRKQHHEKPEFWDKLITRIDTRIKERKN